MGGKQLIDGQRRVVRQGENRLVVLPKQAHNLERLRKRQVVQISLVHLLGHRHPVAKIATFRRVRQ
eukprot:6176882-Pleurochrysis_carterae.AAC.3